MNRTAWVLLALLAAGPLEGSGTPWESAPGQTVETREVQVAGTPVLGERILPVFRTNGQEYLLLLSPWEEAAQALKTGVPAILEGTLVTVRAAGKPPRLLLRPKKVQVRGIDYQLSDDITQELLRPFLPEPEGGPP